MNQHFSYSRAKQLNKHLLNFLIKFYDRTFSYISPDTILDEEEITNCSYSRLVALIEKTRGSPELKVEAIIMEDAHLFEVHSSLDSIHLLYSSRIEFDDFKTKQRVLHWERGSWEERIEALAG